MSAQVYADELKIAASIEGVDQIALQQELAALSDLAVAESAYASLSAIRRAGARDVRRIVEALKSKGYYAAGVEPDYRRSVDKVTVVFNVDTGSKFQISRYAIQYTDKQLKSRVESFDRAGIKTTGNPDGEDLQKLAQAFANHLQETGYPAAAAKRHFVQANFMQANAIAVFLIESGPEAFFGNIVVTGTKQVKPTFIQKYITWTPGVLYERKKLIAYREALVGTGLFGEVSVSPSRPGIDGRVDILVDVKERKRRSVGAGISFATDVGAGGQLFYENRNLLGRGDKFSTRLKVSAPEQEIQINIGRPYPGLPGTLTGTLTTKNETSDAFEAQSAELSVALVKFWFDRKLELRGGLGLNYSQVEDAGVRDEFVFMTFPGAIRWNSEDDLLNPTTGFRTSLSITPFVGDVNFIQTKLSGATRRTFGDNKKFVLAARGALGSSFGIERDDIPATERFFAGGGGSVRGFGFQQAGPLDATLDPIGGASLIELNFEARYQQREKLQLAAFIDTGLVSDNNVPSFSEAAFVGAGFGFRYLTLVGPLRLDLATPLNPRDTDDPLQFYIALGQPF